ncbi:MAG: hypothetical protein ACIARR_13525 [Phycisphaerales bacterium JB059]
MKPIIRLLPAALLMFTLSGCDGPAADGPPDIRIGDSVCAECNMIISDRRWATATIIDGPRGPDPLLFDDFNCQVNHESEHPGLVILARWAHDHTTGDPLRAEDAVFLMSPNLRTPMASKVAAFTSSEEVNAAQAELTGDVMDFEAAWGRLGSDDACCPAEDPSHSDDKEDDDGP